MYQSLKACLVTSLIALLSNPAQAQTTNEQYPSRPITMVVPYPAGQSVDILARIMGEGLTKYLNQPVIIDNKGGAGGTIGSKYLIKMAPDGYTLSMNASGPLGIAPHLFKEANYDPRQDFTPIMAVAAVAQTLVVSSKSNIKSVQDLIQAAKDKPNGLNFGSPGNGSTSHLTQEMFKQQANIKMQHVPYKGGPAAITDLLGGQIDVLFEASPLVLPFIQRGDLRALAVSTSTPLQTLPGVPTISSQGLPNFEAVGWMGIVGPAGMSSGSVNALSAALQKSLTDPAIKSKLDTTGMLIIGGSPQDFGKFIRSEYDKWGAVIKASGISIQ
ncbi:MAG: putative secreted protein [Pseudomonadota bacterium]|jgi:tripartite-type tricarboxylate transporter receptor subunit TctC